MCVRAFACIKYRNTSITRIHTVRHVLCSDGSNINRTDTADWKWSRFIMNFVKHFIHHFRFRVKLKRFFISIRFGMEITLIASAHVVHEQAAHRPFELDKMHAHARTHTYPTEFIFKSNFSNIHGVVLNFHPVVLLCVLEPLLHLISCEKKSVGTNGIPIDPWYGMFLIAKHGVLCTYNISVPLYFWFLCWMCLAGSVTHCYWAIRLM